MTTYIVRITQRGFFPQDIEISLGDSIQWISNDIEDVCPLVSDSVPPLWHQKFIMFRDDFIFTFSEIGVFPYHCFECDFPGGSIAVKKRKKKKHKHKRKKSK